MEKLSSLFSRGITRDQEPRYVAMNGDTDIEDQFDTPEKAMSVAKTRSWGPRAMWLLHMAAFILYSFAYYSIMKQRERLPVLLPGEIETAHPFLEYEDVTFEPSGFHKDGGELTPFEGPPSPATNARWRDLISVGIYAMTPEEASKLGVESTEIQGMSGQRMVAIEMFHQLHCLNMLRHLVFEGADSNPEHDEGNGRVDHKAHCIDYLRQVIMCHGDVTPISLYHDDSQVPPYNANWHIRHTCRNFDRLFEWAASRNTSGMTVS